MSPKNSLLVLGVALLGVLSSVPRVMAADAAPAANLPPLPQPMSVPAPGPMTDAPYAPQAILPGGVVIPLYPPDSSYLDRDRIREP